MKFGDFTSIFDASKSRIVDLAVSYGDCSMNQEVLFWSRNPDLLELGLDSSSTSLIHGCSAVERAQSHLTSVRFAALAMLCWSSPQWSCLGTAFGDSPHEHSDASSPNLRR